MTTYHSYVDIFNLILKGGEYMIKTSIKRAYVGAATFALAALPMMAAAQIDLGMEEVEAIGLGTEDIRTTISGVIRSFMGLLGLVAVIIILLGGFKWMTAGGSEDKVAEAKKLIISGIIGLIIIMSAFAIATFVIGAITDSP